MSLSVIQPPPPIPCPCQLTQGDAIIAAILKNTLFPNTEAGVLAITPDVLGG